MPAVAKKTSTGPVRCQRKFLRFFPKGFQDPKYVDWERGYKWEAHERWRELLGRETHRELISDGEHAEVARRAVTIESRTNLLFSFEKMALRDAVKSAAGAKAFAKNAPDVLSAIGATPFNALAATALFFKIANIIGDPVLRAQRGKELGAMEFRFACWERNMAQ